MRCILAMRVSRGGDEMIEKGHVELKLEEPRAERKSNGGMQGSKREK